MPLVLIGLFLLLFLMLDWGRTTPTASYKTRRVKINSMEGLRIIRKGNTLHAIIKCHPGISTLTIAKAIEGTLNAMGGIEKVVLYKLGMEDDLDKAVANIVQNEVPTGVIIQEWTNLDDLRKYLHAIESGQLPASELCGV